ncbi:MAG: ferrochelatase [Acidobacteriaceae bacterium]
MSDTAKTKEQRAILLLAHGTPDTIDEIPEYLKNVVSGRPMPQHVVEEIQHRYALIGSSPLTKLTLEQAELLQQQIGLPVYVGMRNWRPYIVDTVKQMRADGITSAVAICLAPQNSRTSVGLYRRAAYAEAGTGSDALRIDFIDGWADHPLLAEAFADRLRAAWKKACEEAGRKVSVLFTAHSVPCRTIQTPAATPESAKQQPEETAERATGPMRPVLAERSYALPANVAQGPDPYPVEAKKTAALVAGRLATEGLTDRDWYFAFQSQGASGGPWIGPSVEETMKAIQAEGHAGFVIQPIGFLCDHVEILYDIDIAFTQQATEMGLKLWRPESLNASPLLTDALADLARKGMERLDQQVAVVATT